MARRSGSNSCSPTSRPSAWHNQEIITPVTLINVFALPQDQRDEFLKRWTQTSQVYARTEGFIETHLHENAGVGNPTFQFINFAIWASKEAFLQAHKDYVPGEESIPGISFHPAIFEEVVMMKNLLSTQSEGTE